MNKKIIVSLLATFILTSVHLAAAQQPTKIARIGFLGYAPVHYIDALRQGLRELGWVEGQNITIDYKQIEVGRNDQLPGYAAELVRLKVDVIVTTSTEPALAAQQATKTIPIVMAGGSDPVGSGLVTSLARPGGNITGVKSLLEIGGKRLELLKETFPKVSRVAVLWSPEGRGNPPQMKELEAAAHALHIQLLPV
jgi:putative tryptophan/tyrosine transport system substrate-binding protein